MIFPRTPEQAGSDLVGGRRRIDIGVPIRADRLRVPSDIKEQDVLKFLSRWNMRAASRKKGIEATSAEAIDDFVFTGGRFEPRRMKKVARAGQAARRITPKPYSQRLMS